MALYDTSRPAPFGAVALHRIITFVYSVGEALHNWNSRRKTDAMLRALSDRELSDMGLNRNMIEEIAAQMGRRF